MAPAVHDPPTPTLPKGRVGVVRVRAYAKINLGLEVLGKRPDGLHEVATVMQSIDLADRIEIRPSESISLDCPAMEVTRDNLILQAAYLLKERASAEEGAAIRCDKRIPIGAGLGGGSADAAATLRALISFWDVRTDHATLLDLAASLGADVPFLMDGGTALATGSGRSLQPLPTAPFHWVVLVPISESSRHKTAELYARLGSGCFSDRAAAARQTNAIQIGRVDYSAIQSAFELLVGEGRPEARVALDLLRGSGALAATVTGAGPSVFGLYRSLSRAGAARQRLAAEGLGTRLQRFRGPHPHPTPSTGSGQALPPPPRGEDLGLH